MENVGKNFRVVLQVSSSIMPFLTSINNIVSGFKSRDRFAFDMELFRVTKVS